MSEPLTLKDDNGQPLVIGPTQLGAVGINARAGMTSILIVLSGERLEAFRDAIGLAAAPGRPKKLPRAAKCPRCGLPDGTAPVPGTAAAKCEHIWHQYRPQAELEARQPLTVAAVDPAAMDALGQLADAAQDVVTKDEVDRCGWSEDPYHRCRVCYDYAAGREREHPLTAAQEASDA